MRAVHVLRDAGIDPVCVVVGASGDAVTALLPADVRAVPNPEWATGMGSSLRAGLNAAAELPDTVDAVVVLLVDLPGVTAGMVRRLVEHGGDLVQASFDGTPGHPVLLGRAHWAAVAGSADGDRGARDYLRRHGAVRVPLGSAAAGADVDVAAAHGRRSPEH